MTTSIKVHVNGRYKATVTQKDAEGKVLHSTVIHGNYAGSPNPTGLNQFNLYHPAKGTFDIEEEYVPEEEKPAT